MPTLAKKCELSLVIPFTDQWEFTEKTLTKLAAVTDKPIELVLIDNDSDKTYSAEVSRILLSSNLELKYVKTKTNIGVLNTFKLGLEQSSGEIICFIHNDVMIHEVGWQDRIINAFKADPQLGLAGLFGARGVQPDGGREGSMSNMQGKEWGACECHSPAGYHHGELMTGIAPAAVFDGVGMFFRRSALEDLAKHSDAFADWRAPHHFYDRIFSLKILERGYHMAVIGIEFDHFSGATANHSSRYGDMARNWLQKHRDAPKDIYLTERVPSDYLGPNADGMIYLIAEGQWRKEFGNRTPVYVDSQYNARWTR